METATIEIIKFEGQTASGTGGVLFPFRRKAATVSPHNDISLLKTPPPPSLLPSLLANTNTQTHTHTHVNNSVKTVGTALIPLAMNG